MKQQLGFYILDFKKIFKASKDVFEMNSWPNLKLDPYLDTVFPSFGNSDHFCLTFLRA